MQRILSDELTSHAHETVRVAGWVHRRRDHGGVVFVDLRDRTGLAQVVFKPDIAPIAHAKSGELRTTIRTENAFRLGSGGALPFSPDGKRIAYLTNTDQVVHICEISTGKEVWSVFGALVWSMVIARE